MLHRQFTLAAILALASFTLADDPTEKAPQKPISGTDTVHGCYGSLGTMTKLATIDFNTQGECTRRCRNENKVAAASNRKDCYCGDEYPNGADLVADDKCTEPCPGFGTDACT